MAAGYSQQAKIVPDDGFSHFFDAGPPAEEFLGSSFGQSAAISDDGQLILVGCPRADLVRETFESSPSNVPGAVYVYRKDGETWVLEWKITPDSPDSSVSWFGWSVALSSDGSTAAIGGPTDGAANEFDFEAFDLAENSAYGSMWIYIRELVDDEYVWSFQAKLADRPSGDFVPAAFGMAVGISDDGNTAVAGDPHQNKVFSYTRAGAAWSLEAEIVAFDPDDPSFLFGYSLAYVGNDQLVVGCPYSGSDGTGAPGFPYVGSVFAYERVAGSWGARGSRLSGVGASIGVSVGASENVVAMAGGQEDSGALLWVSTWNDGNWETQALSPGITPRTHEGLKVAVSADGQTLLVGPGETTEILPEGVNFAYPGAVEVWHPDGLGGWASAGVLVPAGEDSDSSCGFGLAITPTGRTLVAGGNEDNVQAGAAWVFVMRTLAISFDDLSVQGS